MVPVVPQFWRSLFILSCFCCLLAVVGGRLHTLQIRQHADLIARAERQHTQTAVVPAVRGGIFDAEGRLLAHSVGTWDCYADPDWMEDRVGPTVHLARIIGCPRDELRAHFESGRNGRCLARDLSDEQAQAIADSGFAGIHLKRVFRRRYPLGDIAPHVLGFVLDDGHGGGGIELELDRQLAGTPGCQRIRTDARGRPCMPIGAVLEAARPGDQVQLTINARIQHLVQRALAEAVARHDPVSASALVLRPATGEILAMASWPTFSPADFATASPASFRNQTLAFVYEPGSTMKPLIAGAAVADGVARWEERIFCENGRWLCRIGRAARTLTDHSVSHGGHQWLTVVEGIAKSDNILTGKLGLRLGPERLRWWALHFGFGQPTGIDLPGESRGLMLPAGRWDRIGSCLSVPMGHEMAVTPLQLAMAHAAIANRGMWQPPRLIGRIVQRDPGSDRSRVVTPPTRLGARRLLTEADALRVQEAMIEVMRHGTGSEHRLVGWTCAGKTGTTEKLIEVGGRRDYSDRNHIGSFVGWAPANPARPAELLALVIIDDPRRNGHYGSQTAGPVVKRILEESLRYLGVPSDTTDTRIELTRREGGDD
jgi:cell division protein FtsI (penicillin-binding protein 3)